MAAAAGVIADVISSAPIYLMRNTADGDVREKSELSRFMDIHPYSLGTRKTLISWTIMTLLTSGEGMPFVLPVTQGGYLRTSFPCRGPLPWSPAPEAIRSSGREGVSPDDICTLYSGRHGSTAGASASSLLKNLRQSAATTNAFLSNNWKP